MAKFSTSVLVSLAIFALFVPTGAIANGKLAIHFLDVGQGDAALLISPQGETVLFDNGALGLCSRPVQYLRQLGISKIDYQIVSHYHADHIGCTTELLGQFPLVHFSYDRGGEYRSGVFGRYLATVGTKRRVAAIGEKLVLDQSSSTPVWITFLAANGNGILTANENDLSLLAHIKFGDFEAVIGGDLSGYTRSGYLDIETSVAATVGPVEVYKVHHHCSSHSTNLSWLTATTPRVAIISAGVGNGYGHPTDECLSRLHAIGTKTYWTSIGHGAIPEFGSDVVGNGPIVLEVGINDVGFTIGPVGGKRDQYSVLEGAARVKPQPVVFKPQ